MNRRDLDAQWAIQKAAERAQESRARVRDHQQSQALAHTRRLLALRRHEIRLRRLFWWCAFLTLGVFAFMLWSY